MPYAANGRIGHDPFPDAVEITQEQYDEALAGMMGGKVVSIDGGFSVSLPPEPEPAPEPEPVDPWVTLRDQRDALLSASDWTQLPDAPVDAEAWAVYRQALRDLPENTTNPEEPTWPSLPE